MALHRLDGLRASVHHTDQQYVKLRRYTMLSTQHGAVHLVMVVLRNIAHPFTAPSSSREFEAKVKLARNTW
jgi:hypothetical protein